MVELVWTTIALRYAEHKSASLFPSAIRAFERRHFCYMYGYIDSLCITGNVCCTHTATDSKRHIPAHKYMEKHNYIRLFRCSFALYRSLFHSRSPCKLRSVVLWKRRYACKNLEFVRCFGSDFLLFFCDVDFFFSPFFLFLKHLLVFLCALFICWALVAIAYINEFLCRRACVCVCMC